MLNADGISLATPCGGMARPPRIPGFDYLGSHVYALTFCVEGRRPVFKDTDLASNTTGIFLRTARFFDFELLPYCVMPDHAHLLAQGRSEGADLRCFATSAKRGTGRAYAFTARRRLWQQGYYDRVLRREDDLLAAARYIVWNPVRAGFVQSPAEYPHVGSEAWWLRELLEP